VKTHRDHFVVGFTDEEIKQRMRTFISNLPDDLVAQSLNLKDTINFKLKTARKMLRSERWEKSILPFSYRPFDNRFICYREELIDRDRHEIMHHLLHENLGLMTSRQVLNRFRHAFVCSSAVNYNFIDLAGQFGTGYIFPLYVYKRTEKTRKSSIKTIMMLFEPDADYLVRKPNFTSAFSEKVSGAFKKSPSPEEIFYYIYAVLYSETYRTKYAEFLKIDFPRVPFTKDYKLFNKMSKYGNMLADLHLLKSPELDSPIARFQGTGDNRVRKLRLSLRGKAEAISKDEILRSAQNDNLSIYINKDQYFEGISQDVWNYQIGGYQVCHKWLKDRKERVLSLEEIQTYCRIVTAIHKTIRIQKEIDKMYNAVEMSINE